MLWCFAGGVKIGLNAELRGAFTTHAELAVPSSGSVELEMLQSYAATATDVLLLGIRTASRIGASSAMKHCLRPSMMDDCAFQRFLVYVPK
jgi:hypothetical protein